MMGAGQPRAQEPNGTDSGKEVRPRVSYFAEDVGPSDVSEAGRLARLYATPSLHRLVPSLLAVPMARARGRLDWWFSKSSRERATAWARAAIGPDSEPRTVRRLARRALASYRATNELQWRPWLLEGVRVENADRLQEASDEGNGLIVVHPILGGRFGHLALLLSLVRLRGDLVLAATPGDRRARGFRGSDGLSKLAFFSRLQDAGVRHLPPGGSFDALGSELRRGGWVVGNADATGSTRGALLGQQVSVGSGPMALSEATGAPIVLCWAERRLGRITIRVGEPIRPSRHRRREQLTAAMLSALEAAVGERLPEWYPQAFPSLEFQRRARIKQLRKSAKADRKRRRDRARTAARGGPTPDEGAPSKKERRAAERRARKAKARARKKKRDGS